MSNPYDEATVLFPFLAKYKKLCVALLGTTTPLVLFLLSGGHTTVQTVAACLGYLATNFGVAAVTNRP